MDEPESSVESLRAETGQCKYKKYIYRNLEND